MRYIIYEMVQPDCIKDRYRDGYHKGIVPRHVLEKVDEPRMESEHPTMEAAITEIHLNKERLKHKQLTIIPVLTIGWDGEVY